MGYYHVYMIKSLADSSQYYTGFTENLKQRLAEHNAGKCPHTRKFLPWTLVTATTFSDRTRALEFERYFKTGSGRAFATRHFR